MVIMFTELGNKGYYKPREIRFLYIQNVKDNIDRIKAFLSYYSNGAEYEFMDIDTSREYSEHDVYTFLRNQYSEIACSDIEDTERYIVFDPDREWIEFDVYTPEEFEKNFILKQN